MLLLSAIFEGPILKCTRASGSSVGTFAGTMKDDDGNDRHLGYDHDDNSMKDEEGDEHRNGESFVDDYERKNCGRRW